MNFQITSLHITKSSFAGSPVARSHVRSAVVCVVLAASLALSGTAAMAASGPAHKTTAAVHVARPHHVAAARRRAPVEPPFALAQFFQSMFGRPIPVTVGSARDTGGYDPTFDSPNSSAVEVDNSQSQAAIDASDQAMQQEDQSLQDLDASIAAAEQQNDAANAATLQTEINAGM
jgi:hypothetical protein